jgi:hypothetical protein
MTAIFFGKKRCLQKKAFARKKKRLPAKKRLTDFF